ncbi:Epoxyqueuosine reductase [Nymphon striatum]|nr:Epoxyqueuosine reductase [Nymphon striatum]
MDDAKVSDEYCITTDQQTTLAMILTGDDGHPDYSFYTKETADCSMEMGDIPAALDNRDQVIHMGSFATALPESGAVFRTFAKREANNCFISFDPNVRNMVLPEKDIWLNMVDEMLPISNFVKASDEDLAFLYPDLPLEDFIDKALEAGVDVACVTRGPDGALAKTANGQIIDLPGRKVNVTDTVGAGDTFQAACLHFLAAAGLAKKGKAQNVELEKMVSFAINAAALTCTRRGADLPTLVEIEAFRVPEFLALNPAGTLPVLVAEAGSAIAGTNAISEYIDETRGAMMRERRLMPDYPLDRAEVRRLIDWFCMTMDADVTRALVRERIFKLEMSPAQGGGAPDSSAMRGARTNIKQHMRYINWLSGTRNWLAGKSISSADFAAAAAISVLDYMGEIEWKESQQARDWRMTQHLTSQKAKDFLIRDLKEQGFDDVRIMSAHDIGQNPERLAAYIEAGYHSSMNWMPETQERRSAPRALWEQANSIAMVVMRYTPSDDYDPLEALTKKSQATISCYAHNRDYHDIIKGKLKQAAGRFVAKTNAQVKVFVDTAPVMEKPLAQKAGLGWQGKHTNLVSRDLGSWFFLGSIFTDIDLPSDDAEIDHCGSCRSCLDICPTDAFPEPYKLDARRCISYLTIEHSGSIDVEFRKPMGNRIYGCDDCLAACPWNKFAETASEAKLQARDDLKSPALRDLLKFDDRMFRTHFSGSPIKRIGRNRFIRNCLIAAGNSADQTLIELIQQFINEDDPVVRSTAVWALAQLMSEEQEVKQLKKTILILGAGFSGKTYGALAAHEGHDVYGTCRSNDKFSALAALGITPLLFDGETIDDELSAIIARATDIVISIAPNDDGDPVLRAAYQMLKKASNLNWIGYLSTVGVYGNHDGAWVDETTVCKPVSKRSVQRVDAENAWMQFAKNRTLPLAILRLSGIYGPGRNALKNMIEGKARRLIKPGQVFNRIHVADIAQSLIFLGNKHADGIFNVTDDMPCPPQDVVEHAALVTKVDPPEPIDFETATLSPMARSFYGENKRVSNTKLKSMGFVFAYPNYLMALTKMWADDNW